MYIVKAQVVDDENGIEVFTFTSNPVDQSELLEDGGVTPCLHAVAAVLLAATSA